MRRHHVGSRLLQTAAVGAVALGCLALTGCNSSNKVTSRVDPRYGVSASPRVIKPGQPVPKGGGTYRVGKPYVVAGRTYYPAEDTRYRRDGIASWYGDDFHGRLTANGEVYDMEGISAAHPTLPMPSYARVTNLHSGRSLIVRVNDRGPYHGQREIDLSSKAAELLGVRRAGTGRVRVEYVGSASLDGSDDRQLMATLREGGPAPAPSAVRVAAARPFVPPAAEPVVAYRPIRQEPVVVAHRPIRPERSFESTEDRDPAAPGVRTGQPRMAARPLPQRSFENDDDREPVPAIRVGEPRRAARALPQRSFENDDDREPAPGVRTGQSRPAARALPQRSFENDDDREPAPLVAAPPPRQIGVGRAAVLSEPLPAVRAEPRIEPLPAVRGEPRIEPRPTARGGPRAEPMPTARAEPRTEPLPAGRGEPRMVWSPGPPPAVSGAPTAYAPAREGATVTTGRGLY